MIRSLNPSAEGFAGLSQKCDATPYRGQRVRISVWIKTDGINGAAQFFFVVNDQAGARLGRVGTGCVARGIGVSMRRWSMFRRKPPLFFTA